MTNVEAARPAPHLILRAVLGASARMALVDVIASHVSRSGVEAASGWADGDAIHRSLDLDIHLGDVFAPLRAALTEVAAVARRELGLPHFAVSAVPHRVSVHTTSGVVHSAIVDADVPVGRRIEFVYTVIPHGGAVAGGSIRLHDTVAGEGPEHAGEGYTEIHPVDNSLLLFPSGHHHEITKVRPDDGTGESSDRPVVYTVRGWLAGDPLRSAAPALSREAANAVQAEFLPRLTDTGYEIRPTPLHVHKLLAAVLDLRGGRRRPEGADRSYHDGDDPGLVPIEDLADDLLAELKPLHEEWCGTELVASAAFGMRCYGAGNSLVMHVDRATTHIVSSIIQVAQDVDEPWPLLLECDGIEHSVILNPGQMVLYEGATTPHGRPSPLRGRSFVNLFLHYRPTGWTWTPELLAQRAFEDGLVNDGGRLL